MKTCKSCEHYHTVCYCSWCAKDKVWVRTRPDKPACRKYRIANRILRKIIIGMIVAFAAVIMIIAAVTYHKNRYAVILPPETKYEQQTKRSAALSMYPLETHDSFTVFELVESITGIDRKLIYATCMRESDLCINAVGDNGNSKGLGQSYEVYRQHNIGLMGYEYDPFDPFDAALLCARKYAENKQYFNDKKLLIASYRQGVTGVQDNGITSEKYVADIMEYEKEYSRENVVLWEM